MNGLIWAEKFAPSHVMFVDADDCISKHLTAFVEAHHQCNGWLIQKGYLYKDGSYNIYFNSKNFYKICGTCNIIKYNLYDFKTNDKSFILNYYGGHKYITTVLLEKGIVIEKLPFIGAIYIVENGENYYNKYFSNFLPNKCINRLISLKNYRILSNSIRQEFGLYSIKP